MRLAKYAPVCSESLTSHKLKKNEGRSIAQKSLLRRRCGKDFQFGATILLCVFATGCDKTDWQLRAGKRYRCGDAPAMQGCSWRLLNALQHLRERIFSSIVLPLGYGKLQLEVAKRNVLDVRREELVCRSSRRGRGEAFQGRSRLDERLLREEGAARRST